MRKFEYYESFGIPMMSDNIDTDIIIPKQYLKTVKKKGFADCVFAPWRYDAAGDEISSFVLNKPEYRGAGILITGENFGCGSSREHAAWALQDFGIRVVIAGGYGPIFYNNWLGNGNLPVVLDRESREFLAGLPLGEKISIDLPAQKVVAEGREFGFDLDPEWKARLMAGKDAIDVTLEHEDKIAEYEKIRSPYL